MKPTAEEIEDLRHAIVSQAIDDQRGPVGSPYYHVQMFSDAINAAYEKGLADGKTAARAITGSGNSKGASPDILHDWLKESPGDSVVFGVPFSTSQNLALKCDEKSPRWDLNPPQREEHDDDHAYALALRDYADRLIAAGSRTKPRRPGRRK